MYLNDRFGDCHATLVPWPVHLSTQAVSVMVFGVVLCGPVWAAGADRMAPGDPVVITVPPGGNNAADRIEQAVMRARHLGRARDRVVEVRLAAGVYELRRPVRIGSEDSGSWRHPLVIRGAGRERTRILGSVAMVPFRGSWDDLRRRLPASARRAVRAFALPRQRARADRAIAVRRFHVKPAPPIPFEIFDGQGALRPARWPNEGWARGVAEGAGLRIKDAPVAAWRQEPDLWLEGYFRYPWSFEALPVGSVLPNAGILIPARSGHYGFGPNDRVAVVHTLAELDQPGEWYVDSRRGVILVWPRARSADGKHDEQLRMSVATHGFRLDGANHIRLSGFALQHARHDGIVVAGGMDVGISEVAVRWVGGRCVVVANSRASHVVGSMMSDCGEGGLSLSGGDRPTLRAGRLLAADNRIVRYARLGRTYKPAIALHGVGHQAIGNVIAEGPHMAIALHGNDHIVRNNEISHVVQDTSDAGAIYIGRDVTARGHRIERNFLHDIRGSGKRDVKGVYLDDFASGITVRQNVFLRVDQPVFIGGGQDNRVIDNLFVASSPAVHIDARGLNWAAQSVHDPESALRSAYAAMPVASPVWRAHYPALAAWVVTRPGVPARNVIRGNVIVDGNGVRLEEGVSASLQTIVAPPVIHLQDNDRRGLDTMNRARELAQRLHDLGLSGLLPAIPFPELDRRAVLERSQQ